MGLLINENTGEKMISLPVQLLRWIFKLEGGTSFKRTMDWWSERER